MAQRKINPAIELPTQLAATICNYIGTRRMNKLSADQNGYIMQACINCALEIGRTLEAGALDEADKDGS